MDQEARDAAIEVLSERIVELDAKLRRAMRYIRAQETMDDISHPLHPDVLEAWNKARQDLIEHSEILDWHEGETYSPVLWARG